MTSIEEIFKAVQRERRHQDCKYGVVGKDRVPTIGDWILILEEEISEARLAQVKGNSREALQELLQVATVAVAALQQHGLVERDNWCRGEK